MATLRLNGWIRIWITLSTLWVACFCVFAYDDIVKVFGKQKYEVSKDDKHIGIIVFSKATNQSSRERDLENIWLPKLAANPEKYKGEFTEPYDSYIEKHGPNTIAGNLGVILVPPVLLLLIGWVTSWIREGFLLNKTNKE